MPLIRPFAGLRPVAGRAADVVAPPYDVLSSSEARVRAEGRPWSFLHISKPEIDLPEDIDPYDDLVYAKAAENLDHMREQGVLARDDGDYYYVYRLKMGAHVQTGLVAAASVTAYEEGRIKKHEFTRPQKEDDRVRQVDALDAQTGPVFLVYAADSEVDGILAAVAGEVPDMEVTADDGVVHTLWLVREPDLIGRISQRFDAMAALYVADGHHRSAAASRVAAARREANPAHSGDEPYNYFLAVMFPHDQMQILDYNRVVADLNGLSEEAFLDRLVESCFVEPSESAVKPGRAAEFGMYLGGQWFRLSLRPELVPDDPVRSLDVSLLADNIIEPVLGISDPRRDSRIDFVGGIRGLNELERRVDSGEMAVAFAMFPTSMPALMAVADAGEVMPPKSTWFEPKLADGVVSHLLK
ncbi:MAG: DUF1015 domain-containing protein [Chromatiales bacterium]|nr:DUF1015 domain-containing protein [Chromatiales bacterium]